jgi:uncharacterized repeat protein (TIGR03803 family)
VFKLTPPVPPATNWTETVLHSFREAPDGARPQGGVIFDASGNLYGTTGMGGPNGTGTVFKLAPPALPATQWTETVLYSFDREHDGERPVNDVIFAGGALYGATFLSGPSKNGTLFKLTPPVPPATQWTETVLYSFKGLPDDGANPSGRLMLDSSGALYGTTKLGRSPDQGTVFKLTPPVPPATQWTETVVYTFKGVPGGGYPFSGLILDRSGALYGTTQLGGTSNNGAVFILR